MKISSVSLDDKGKFIEFKFINNKLLRGKDAMESIFTALKGNNFFKEFGYHKVILTTAIFSNSIGERSYHPNVLITNDMPFETFYKKITDYISNHYDTNDYLNETPNGFTVMV